MYLIMAFLVEINDRNYGAALKQSDTGKNEYGWTCESKSDDLLIQMLQVVRLAPHASKCVSISKKQPMFLIEIDAEDKEYMEQKFNRLKTRLQNTFLLHESSLTQINEEEFFKRFNVTVTQAFKSGLTLSAPGKQKIIFAE